MERQGRSDSLDAPRSATSLPVRLDRTRWQAIPVADYEEVAASGRLQSFAKWFFEEFERPLLMKAAGQFGASEKPFCLSLIT